MSLKKSIIILIIIFIAVSLFVVYLFDVSKVKKYKNNNQIKSTQNNKVEISDQNQEIKENLNLKELKENMLNDLNKISDQKYKNKLIDLSENEKKELKQQMLNDLDKISD